MFSWEPTEQKIKVDKYHQHFQWYASLSVCLVNDIITKFNYCYNNLLKELKKEGNSPFVILII